MFKVPKSYLVNAADIQFKLCPFSLISYDSLPQNCFLTKTNFTLVLLAAEMKPRNPNFADCTSFGFAGIGNALHGLPSSYLHYINRWVFTFVLFGKVGIVRMMNDNVNLVTQKALFRGTIMNNISQWKLLRGFINNYFSAEEVGDKLMKAWQI